MKKKICIVFDHPYTAEAFQNQLHNRSYSAALLQEAIRAYQEKGYEVDVLDLHADGFDPVMHREDLAAWRQKVPLNSQVLDYQERLLEAHELMFIFPIWWELMPAMTKGFIDKVVAKGLLYQQTKKGLFQSKFESLERVQLVTTMATPDLIYRFLFGNPICKSLFRGTFRKMGIHRLKWYNFAGVENWTLDRRKAKLVQFNQKLRK